jgi:hypothetical protein
MTLARLVILNEVKDLWQIDLLPGYSGMAVIRDGVAKGEAMRLRQDLLARKHG